MSNVFRKPSQEDIISLLKQAHPEAGRFQPHDALDKAIVGVTGDGRLVYSENRILLAMQEEQGLDFEDALSAYEALSNAPDIRGRRPPVVIVHEP